MKKFLILSVIVGVGGLGVGVGRHLNLPVSTAVEVAAATSSTTVTTTATTAPATSPPTTAQKVTAATTPTTRQITPTTTKPPLALAKPVVAPVAAPTCSVRALASPAVKGTTQTIYVTSNLPGLVADVGMKAVPMDASGSGKISFPSPGGQMNQFGQVTPKTLTVSVKFYSVPWTLNDIIDPPFPPTLTACTTTYQAIG